MTDTQQVRTTTLGVVLLVGGGALLAVQVKAAGRVEGLTAYIGAAGAFLGALCISPDAIASGFKLLTPLIPWAKARATAAVPVVKDEEAKG